MFDALKNMFARETAATGTAKRVLNVGGGSKAITLPPHFRDWEHLLLDIDPRGGADLVCDARTLRESAAVSAEEFDAIYCSHNLEHYYRHDVDKVLRGFLHVLNAAGFAEIRVPDIGELIKVLATNDLDLEQDIYKSALGPITAHDMIFGYGPEIEASGQDFYAHKTGFSADSLIRALRSNGFGEIYFAPRLGELELHVFAFKTVADAGLRAALALREPVATQARHDSPMPARRAVHATASSSETDPVEALYQRAAAAWSGGDWVLAASLCNQAIALEPDLPALHYLQGCCRMEQAQHESALQSFGRCLELRPKEPLLAETLAQQALCRERIELARAQGSRG